MRLKHRLLLIGFVIISAAVYLIGNGSVALWDRDEPRYAQTSRQMLQSGDWVVPHYLDMIRTAKPALIYWCQATAMEIFGDNAFAARFPSAIAIVILLIVLLNTLPKSIGKERAYWTVFIFATSGLTIASAKMCITDAVLLLFITVAQLCLYRIWRGTGSWPVVITLGVAVGLAGLTKGPVILGMQAMTVLALFGLLLLDRKYPPIDISRAAPPGETSPMNRDRFKPIDKKRIALKTFAAILIAAALILPWVVMVNHRAAEFLRTTLSHDVWDRMMTPLEQHTGPPGYYLLTIWATLFPWSLFLPLAIGLAFRYRANPQTRFALAAAIGPWFMLELVRTKLPHYLLPAFPPLAFLIGEAIVRTLRKQHDEIYRRGFLIGVGVWALLIALATAGPWVTVMAVRPLPWMGMITLTTIGLLLAITVFILFLQKQLAKAAVLMGIGTFAMVIAAYGLYLPNAQFLQISPRVASVLKANGATERGQVGMYEYMEPSLAFYQGGTIRELATIRFLPPWAGMFREWMVLPKEKFDAAPDSLKNEFDVIATVRGLAYADRMKWKDVMVIHRKVNPTTKP